ncbi:YlcI/YnfO family protein [Pelomonas sp. Root1444]|uniref:YlcI/YnfO family protein n=1 Tax=Pelomonas sp. Root1444 TaxID=1736464 RepID=UPI0007026D95|nr:YlcI/YnfO family protein [Pelomonas sp. Root1444]KQY88275.1 prevent-host-death protein [Pelomonas sp. Root1444]
MKTASLPSLRVEPELRDAAQSVLEEGETLSSFIEGAVRQTVERRRVQAEFIERGLRSRDQARDSGDYVEATVIFAKLERKLDAARAQVARKRK